MQRKSESNCQLPIDKTFWEEKLILQELVLLEWFSLGCRLTQQSKLHLKKSLVIPPLIKIGFYLILRIEALNNTCKVKRVWGARIGFEFSPSINISISLHLSISLNLTLSSLFLHIWLFSLPHTHIFWEGIVDDDRKLKVLRRLWNTAAPSKYSVLAWRLFWDGLPSRTTWHHRGVLHDIHGLSCVFCFEEEEATDLLFFSCRFSAQLWLSSQ